MTDDQLRIGARWTVIALFVLVVPLMTLSGLLALGLPVLRGKEALVAILTTVIAGVIFVQICRLVSACRSSCSFGALDEPPENEIWTHHIPDKYTLPQICVGCGRAPEVVVRCRAAREDANTISFLKFDLPMCRSCRALTEAVFYIFLPIMSVILTISIVSVMVILKTGIVAALCAGIVVAAATGWVSWRLTRLRHYRAWMATPKGGHLLFRSSEFTSRFKELNPPYLIKRF